ncbi:ABC transporter permease subunit [Carnimonas bestiolae]|uniref:ABC transporter permease subunit n=1 Tax=Carnimonas bestiolae TaxID=3402172 RepID=UPI003EDBF7FF
MARYLTHRLVLLLVTLVGILLINFALLQAAPGGPADQIVAQLQSMGQGEPGAGAQRAAGGAAALDQRFIDQLNHTFGLDQPWYQRFATMVKNYALFDFGDSFFQGERVSRLIIERLPVTLSLGFWSLLIAYMVSIPLGIAQAMRAGARFDGITSFIVVVGYAVPPMMWALILVTLFASGQYVSWLPLRGLVSADFAQLSLLGKVGDYLSHITLPVLSYTLGAFAILTLMTRNSFLDQIHSQYVLTARAKGASERRVLYRHVFRNAMLVIISGVPATVVAMLISGSVVIESMFSLDGLGQLGYQALQQRDYPVIFGTLFIFSLLQLLSQLLSDLLYLWIDPRLSFEAHS